MQDAEMDGFLQHLQNAQKEAVIKEETALHFYSSKDVDMYQSNIFLFSSFNYASIFMIAYPFDASLYVGSQTWGCIIKVGFSHKLIII